jgi:hypothetical protein
MFRFSTDLETIGGVTMQVIESGDRVYLVRNHCSTAVTVDEAKALHRQLSVWLHERSKPATPAEHDRALLLGVTVEQMRRSDAIYAETVAMLEKEMTPEALDKSSSKPPLLKPKEFEAAAVGIHDGTPWAGVESHMVLGGES